MKEKHREGLIAEKRLFFPPTGFSSKAVIQNPKIHELGQDQTKFWGEQGKRLDWLFYTLQFLYCILLNYPLSVGL